MRASTLALTAVLAAVPTGAVPAADLFVICHSSVKLQPEEVRDVYFGDKAFAGTVKLLPAENTAAQAVFLDRVMKLDAKKYSRVWVKKAFREGAAPPPAKASDAEAIAYVKSTAGACSYVGSAPGDGLVVVARF